MNEHTKTLFEAIVRRHPGLAEAGSAALLEQYCAVAKRLDFLHSLPDAMAVAGMVDTLQNRLASLATVLGVTQQKRYTAQRAATLSSRVPKRQLWRDGQ